MDSKIETNGSIVVHRNHRKNLHHFPGDRHFPGQRSLLESLTKTLIVLLIFTESVPIEAFRFTKQTRTFDYPAVYRRLDCSSFCRRTKFNGYVGGCHCGFTLFSRKRSNENTIDDDDGDDHHHLLHHIFGPSSTYLQQQQQQQRDRREQKTATSATSASIISKLSPPQNLNRLAYQSMMELFGDQEPPIPPQSSTSISKWKSSLAIEPSQPKPPSSSSSSLLLAKTLPEFLVNQNNGFDLLNMMNDGKRLIVSYKNTDNINSNNNNNNNNDIHKQKRNENEQTSINSNKNNNNNNNTPNNIEPKKIRDSSSPPSLIDVDDLVMINA